jgi:N-acetylmuramoyl-L-alanine amidase
MIMFLQRKCSILLLLTGAIFLFLFLGGCARGPYHATNKSYKKQAAQYAKLLKEYPVKDSFTTATNWVGAVNFNMRKPNYVIIHHTAQNSCEQTLKTFTLTRTQVSAHYVICKNGTIFHMVNDMLRAWHGGAAKWGGLTDINSASIGIELDNNGFETFSEPQLQSLTTLLGSLKRAYGIPTANFIGHGDIAPTRKNDPNWRFPWKRLADNGFGLWYTEPLAETPASFSIHQSLRLIGYDTKDSAAATRAFKRHFLQDSTVTPLDAKGRQVLYQMSNKY